MTKLIELIYTEKLVRVKTEDPYRLVSQLWTKDGRLIAEYHEDHKSGHCNLRNILYNQNLPLVEN